jgi:hypothetical protein
LYKSDTARAVLLINAQPKYVGTDREVSLVSTQQILCKSFFSKMIALRS